MHMEPGSHFRIKQMSPQFLVKDIGRSIAFYTNEMGFFLDFRYEDFYCGISKDGFSIHLKTGNPSVEERNNKRKNDDLDIMFSVENIRALYEYFCSRPVEMIQPLRTMNYGQEFYLADPDGYFIAFLETGA